MKKTLLVFLIVAGAGFSKESYAQPKVSPQAIENFVRRMCPMTNDPRGALLEKRFHITEYRDGKWTCDDRAEVAKRVAIAYGYGAVYGIDKTSDPNVFHRYVILSDKEGHQHTIMRSRVDPPPPPTSAQILIQSHRALPAALHGF